MINIKVSIVTISYNSENCIKETIESVLNQSYRPLQYIIKDGLSIDNTMKIANSYIEAFKNANIEYNIISKNDDGISDAFNQGIDVSNGEIIGLINSGDSYVSDVIAKVVDEFDEDIGLICGDVLWYDVNNNISYVRKSRLDYAKLKYCMTIMHPSCFVRKVCYDKFGAFDTKFKYAMDYDLLCKFYRNNVRFKYVPLTIANMASGGVSDTHVEKIKLEILNVNYKNGCNKLLAEINWKLLVIKHNISKIVKKIFGKIWIEQH